MTPYELKTAFILISSLLFGTPQENYERCISSGVYKNCRSMLVAGVYRECMFWCLDDNHCSIGAEMAGIAVTHTKQAANRMRELRNLMEESWNTGGCGGTGLFIIDDTGLYYPIRRQTPKALLVVDPIDNSTFRVTRTGKVLRKSGRKPEFGKDPIIVRM